MGSGRCLVLSVEVWCLVGVDYYINLHPDLSLVCGFLFGSVVLLSRFAMLEMMCGYMGW